jgi:hypothetical protein
MFRAFRATDLLPGVVIVLALLGGCTKKVGDAGSQPVANRAANSDKFAVSFSAETPTGSAGPRGPAEPAGTRPTATAQEPDATSRGKIVGVVKWTGPVPKLDPILVNKDAHVCAEHGRHDRESESLIVNASNGGVKDSVVYLFGKFEDGKPLSELNYPDTLNQRQCSYQPRVFVVPINARIAVTSEDEVGHNVRMQGAADLNIAIAKGGRTSRKFEQAGLVKLGCDIHPWMSGYVHVAKHPYYAVTDAEGQFELTDVPPGEHQIKLWHEAWWTEGDKLASPIVSTNSVTVHTGEITSVTFDFSDPAQIQMAKSASAKGASKR